MLISVSSEDKAVGRKVIWAEKIDDNTFICPKCKNRKIIIIYIYMLAR